jgi:hypothetical protein
VAAGWHHLQTLASLALPLALPVERITGRLRGSDAVATLIHAGEPATASFVAGAILDGMERESIGRLRSPLTVRGPRFRGWCERADLAVVELPPLWSACLPAGMRLRMPAWVSQEIRGPNGGVIALPAALRSEVERHCRREGYQLCFTTAPEAIRRFYAELYRPYVSGRFGDGAVLVDEPRFLAVGRGMTLATLQVGDAWAAGLLFRRRGTTLHLGWFGAATQPPRAGASEVLDARVIEHGLAQGVRRVVMGHSRPRLTDGVLRYKGRFGAVARPTRFPQRVIGLQVLRPSAALTRSLNAARFLVFHEGLPVAGEFD